MVIIIIYRKNYIQCGNRMTNPQKQNTNKVINPANGLKTRLKLSAAIGIAERRSQQRRKIKAQNERKASASRQVQIKIEELKEKRESGPRLKLSEEIFAWGKRFLNTPEYKRIARLERIDKGFNDQIVPQRLQIFRFEGADSKGHTHGVGGDCWMRVYLHDNGSIGCHYLPYKFYGAGREIVCSTPKKLAAELDYCCIKALHEHLTSGKAEARLAEVLCKS